MNATFDIKTPSGKSLEGFPVNLETGPDTHRLFGLIHHIYYGEQPADNPTLHKGDVITITIV